MTDLYEECRVHKEGSTPEQYLIETAQWEEEIVKLCDEPGLVIPKELGRKELRQYLRDVEAGKIKGEWR